jgi:hypothetical protein
MAWAAFGGGVLTRARLTRSCDKLPGRARVSPCGHMQDGALSIARRVFDRARLTKCPVSLSAAVLSYKGQRRWEKYKVFT